jgi:hypothetical protein
MATSTDRIWINVVEWNGTYQLLTLDFYSIFRSGRSAEWRQ